MRHLIKEISVKLMTGQTANEVKYDSFYYEFLIHVGFIFCKTFLELRKKNPKISDVDVVRHQQTSAPETKKGGDAGHPG